jgi:hypothetical protein
LTHHSEINDEQYLVPTLPLILSPFYRWQGFEIVYDYKVMFPIMNYVCVYMHFEVMLDAAGCLIGTGM